LGAKALPFDNSARDNSVMRTRLTPLIAVFAGGLAYSLIPSGAFGAYRVVGDAAIVSAAALVVGLLFFALSKRHAGVGSRAS